MDEHADNAENTNVLALIERACLSRELAVVQTTACADRGSDCAFFNAAAVMDGRLFARYSAGRIPATWT